MGLPVMGVKVGSIRAPQGRSMAWFASAASGYRDPEPEAGIPPESEFVGTPSYLADKVTRENAL